MLKQALYKASTKYPFGIDDLFQQIIGSAILISPFIFTEEVWRIAENTSGLQSLILVSISMIMGHGILYVARQERDWEDERKFMGLTIRYISLMTVSFGTIVIMLNLMGITQTFNASTPHTLKTISILSIFAVIGAATADNLI